MARLIAYTVTYNDENGTEVRTEFPATTQGYIDAVALRDERNRIHRTALVETPDSVPSDAYLGSVTGMEPPKPAVKKEAKPSGNGKRRPEGKPQSKRPDNRPRRIDWRARD